MRRGWRRVKKAGLAKHLPGQTASGIRRLSSQRHLKVLILKSCGGCQQLLAASIHCRCMEFRYQTKAAFSRHGWQANMACLRSRSTCVPAIPISRTLVCNKYYYACRSAIGVFAWKSGSFFGDCVFSASYVAAATRHQESRLVDFGLIPCTRPHDFFLSLYYMKSS